MAITGLLSTAPTVTPGAGTNSQFLDQYMREYDRLERQWLSSMGQNMVQYPAGRPYTPGPFSQPHPMLFYGGGSVAAAKRDADIAA